MAIDTLDQECCTGCGICFAVCPQDVFRMDSKEEKAFAEYPEDCVACCSCEFFCPVDCINVSLNRPRELASPY